MEDKVIVVRNATKSQLERMEYLFKNTNVSKVWFYSTGEIGINYSGGVEYDGIIKTELIKRKPTTNGR